MNDKTQRHWTDKVQGYVVSWVLWTLCGLPIIGGPLWLVGIEPTNWQLFGLMAIFGAAVTYHFRGK